MGEPDDAVANLHDARADRGRECLGSDTRLLEQRRRCGAERGQELEAGTRLLAETADPRAEELFERGGNRERVERVGVAVQPDLRSELERVERIADGALVNEKERLPWDRPVETLA